MPFSTHFSNKYKNIPLGCQLTTLSARFLLMNMTESLLNMPAHINYEPARFLRALEQSGVDFTERVDLEERLLVSSNWRSLFARLISSRSGNGWRIHAKAGQCSAEQASRLFGAFGFRPEDLRDSMSALGFSQ